MPPLTDEDRPRVVVLYVVHNLFGVDNPPSGHDKPNCCADGLPSLDDAALVTFLRRGRQFNRGR